jgi:hypothetical protein
MYVFCVLGLADQAVESRIPVGTNTALRIGEMLDQCVFFNSILGVGGNEHPGKQGNQDQIFQFHDCFEQLRKLKQSYRIVYRLLLAITVILRDF